MITENQIEKIRKSKQKRHNINYKQYKESLLKKDTSNSAKEIKYETNIDSDGQISAPIFI